MAFHHFIRDGEGWRTVSTEIQHANPYLEVQRILYTSPTRPEPYPWMVCHRKGGVVIASITAEGKFVMIRQERPPIRATIWEFPAGQIDDNEEPDAIRATALRELREEAGHILAPGGELLMLGYYFPSAGFTDEHSHILLARPVIASPDGAHHDAGESIVDCRAFSREELRAMIASGEVRDANTLAAFARMTAMGLL